MQAIKPYQAIEAMRKLSKDNIPFSFSFLTCNLSNHSSTGIKRIKRAVLRTGLSSDRGIKSRSLIAYTDLDTDQDRWFYLPLLLTFNNHEICLK